MSKIGKNIRKIRGVKKINQSDFANLFSISRASVGAYEEGRAEPKIETIIKISEHYNIPVDKLLKEEVQVNDIMNFKLNNPKIDLSKHNLTQGRKIKIKEIELKAKPNSKRKPQDLIKVPVNHNSKEYLAILNSEISICRKSTDIKEDVNRNVFLELDNRYVRTQLILSVEQIKIKETGELLPENTIVWVVESEIITPNNAQNISMEERVSRIERELGIL